MKSHSDFGISCGVSCWSAHCFSISWSSTMQIFIKLDEMHLVWSLCEIKHTKFSPLRRGVHTPVSLLYHPRWCQFCHMVARWIDSTSRSEIVFTYVLCWWIGCESDLVGVPDNPAAMWWLQDKGDDGNVLLKDWVESFLCFTSHWTCINSIWFYVILCEHDPSPLQHQMREKRSEP